MRHVWHVCLCDYVHPLVEAFVDMEHLHWWSVWCYAAVIGYVEVTGRLDLGAWLLLAMLFLWQPPHFWALAIRRVEDYRAGGFPLLPVVKGIERTKIQMIPYLVLQIFVPILMYAYGYAGIFYLTVSLILSVLWLYYALIGFRAKNTDAWAKKVFLYSINYLSLSFILMILDTVHK